MIVECRLLGVGCSLFVARCLMRLFYIDCGLLIVVCCLSFVVCCCDCVMCCSLCVARGLFVMWCCLRLRVRVCC